MAPCAFHENQVANIAAPGFEVETRSICSASSGPRRTCFRALDPGMIKFRSTPSPPTTMLKKGATRRQWSEKLDRRLLVVFCTELVAEVLSC